MTDKHYLQREFEELMRDPATMMFLDEGALDGLWYWDIEAPEHEWMSPGFWRTLGFDPAERQHLAAEWQDLIFPEDRDLALENFQRHLADPGHPYDQLVRYRTAEGGTVTVRCRGKAIREGGTPKRMLGAHTVVHDTRQHEMTRQLSEMLELSGDAILAWSADRGIQRWNRGATQLYGFTREEAEGRSPARLLQPKYPQPWSEIEATLAAGEEWNGEVVWTRKDGSTVPTSSRFQRLEVIGGDAMILQIDRDISERREAEERQALLTRELDHRVKNLFSVIQAIVVMSAQGASDVRALVEKIRGRIGALSSAHMTSMNEGELARVPLAEMVDGVLAPYREADRLVIDGPSVDLPPKAVTPLGLVLHELATNAVKHGAWSTNGGRVELRWSIEDTAPNGAPKGDGPAHLRLEWRERSERRAEGAANGNGAGQDHGGAIGANGKDVRSRTSFGTRLIQQSVLQLGGTVETALREKGFEASLRFPIGPDLRSATNAARPAQQIDEPARADASGG